MKKIVLLFIVIIALTFQACDKIDGPYTVPYSGQSAFSKKVLIEDYTGHTCVNCPCAANEAKSLEAIYDTSVVVMAVHVGYFAQPNTQFPQDFTTTAGTDWDNKFNISTNGLPQGMINRLGYPNSNIVPFSAWASNVATLIAQAPYMSMSFQNNAYNAATGIVSGSVDVKFIKLNNLKLNLQICITEDSIIGPQSNNCDNTQAIPTITNYVFMHILRTAVNGSWGTTITSGSAYNLVGSDILTPYSYTIPTSNWKAKNCHLVAFVYDANTYEVLQVQQISVQ